MERDFDDVRRKFAEFWPKADLPPAVAELWRSRLSGLNMNCLYECLDDVRVKYYANTPQLKWVLDAYYSVWENRFKSADNSALDKANAMARIAEERKEADEFNAKVERELSACSDNELRAAASRLPFNVSHDPSEWGRVTKGMVWVKLFGNSRSSVNRSHSQDQGLLV